LPIVSLIEKNLKLLLKYNYHQNIIHIIKEEDFKEENLQKYLDFFFQYKTADNYDIIYLVNHGEENISYNKDIHEILHTKDFKDSNFERYLAFYQEYELNGDYVVMAVNQDLDKEDIPVDDTVLLFLGKKYSLTRNLERYKNYYKTHKELEVEEIIARVNSNLDKTFYKDVLQTDLEKDNLLIVNKFYYLEEDFIPDNLVSIDSKYGRGEIKEEAYQAFLELYEEASKEDLHPYISSPYRSYNRQNQLYTNYSNKDGINKADTYSARPGYSEHQTGLAMDLGTSNNTNINDFENSKEFEWMQKNAHKYGFILRYPKDKEHITGYLYEPWHYRYVGIKAAKQIHDENLTLEEYIEKKQK